MSQDLMEHNALAAARRNLSWEQLALLSAKKIEAAISDLLGLQERAETICRAIKREFDYDFVALQVVDRRAQTIQTVYGIGANQEAWYTSASHSIEGPKKYLDIQAHIAITTPPTAETIAGPHEKFDKFIYDKFGHKHFVRAFVPMIVARDADGRLIPADLGKFHITTTRTKSSRIIQLNPRHDGSGHARTYEIIGTIEAGFDNTPPNRKRVISAPNATRLLDSVCHHAYLLCRCTLLSVLQVIAESAREITGADAITLHFPFIANMKCGADEAERHPYEAWVGPQFADFRPRAGGLGVQAITKGRPMFLPQLPGKPGKNRLALNPLARRAGIRSMAAFPLIVRREGAGLRKRTADDLSAGALYVGYRQEHKFTRGEIDGVQLFTGLAKDAIRHASAHVQTLQATRQLYNLHEIARALADESDDHDLLSTIAGHAMNVLAADIVIIYEYRADDKEFVGDPAVAGRYDPFPGDPGARGDGRFVPPPSLIKRLAQKQGILTAATEQKVCALYAGSGAQRPGMDFIRTQNLKAGVAVSIRLRDEDLGIMFVNYRRTPLHSDAEIRSTATALAATAAVAIHTRRALQARQSSLHAMTHQIKSPINALELAAVGIRQSVTRDGPATAEREDLLEGVQFIQDNLRLLSLWCDGVYTSLSSEAGKRMPLQSADIGIEGGVKRLWGIIKNVKDADQTLDFSVGMATPATIRIDPMIFENVVYCLLDNVPKYADGGSVVNVDWSISDGCPRLSVRTIGQPILREDNARIYRRFGQGLAGISKVRSQREGSGMGLWVASGLLRLVGGRIWHDTNGRVTTFNVEFERKEGRIGAG